MIHPRDEQAPLTIRLGAVRENYRLCVRLATAAKVAGVVKADAYGLGMGPIAQALAGAGCDMFFVARLDEGIALRGIAHDARIFVLDGVRSETVSPFLSHNLTPVLNSLAQLEAWQKAALRGKASLDAALHVDTGMNRLGFPAYEISVLSGESRPRLKGVNVCLVMSHLACADDPRSPMNTIQLDRFRAALASLPPAPASFASSAGIMLGRDYLFDIVRPGVALYGGNPQPENANPFKVVAVLRGRIVQLRRVDSGESVGYGATFSVERPTTLATVALGYADGLMRAIGNRGAAGIGGIRVPIVGRVSMDLITLDVTGAPATALYEGAEAEFLGDTVSLEDLADAAGSASYEILTSLRGRVARRYVEAA